MPTTAKQIETGDIRIIVCPDREPESPRDWDNLGTITIWHGRYNLGDAHEFKRPIHFFTSFFDKLAEKTKRTLLVKLIRSNRHIWNDYKNGLLCDEMGPDHWEDFIDCQMENGGTAEQMEAVHAAASEVALILPVFIYEHSGITLSTGPFNCPFDSGQAGFTWVLHEDLGKIYTDERLANGQKSLEVELETYGRFVSGDVWGFIVQEAAVCSEGHAHWEHVDSCGGFYGTEWNNGMSAHCAEEHHEKLREALANPEYSNEY